MNAPPGTSRLNLPAGVPPFYTSAPLGGIGSVPHHPGAIPPQWWPMQANPDGVPPGTGGPPGALSNAAAAATA